MRLNSRRSPLQNYLTNNKACITSDARSWSFSFYLFKSPNSPTCNQPNLAKKKKDPKGVIVCMNSHFINTSNEAKSWIF